MTMELGFFGAILLIANLYAVYNIWNSDASLGGKIVWSIVLFLFPLIGFLAWLFFGPRG